MSFKEEVDKLVRKKQEKSERENAIPWSTLPRNEMRKAVLEPVPRNFIKTGKGQGHYEKHSEQLRRLERNHGTSNRDITSGGDYLYTDGYSENMKIQPIGNLFNMKPNVLGKTNNQFKLNSDIFSRNMTNKEAHIKAEKDIFGLRPVQNQPRLRSDRFSKNLVGTVDVPTKVPVDNTYTPTTEEKKERDYYAKRIAEGKISTKPSEYSTDKDYVELKMDTTDPDRVQVYGQSMSVKEAIKHPVEAIKQIPHTAMHVAKEVVGAVKQAPQQFKRINAAYENVQREADNKRIKELESLRIRAQLEKTRATVNYHQAKAAQLSGQGQSRIGGGIGGMSLGGGIGGGIGLGGGFSGGGQQRDPLALPSTGISMGGGMSLGPSRESEQVPNQGVTQYRPIRERPQHGAKRLDRKTGQYSVRNPDYKPKVQWRKVKYVDEHGRVIAMMVPKEPRDSTLQELESRGQQYGY